ncbi:MAG: DNA polymerase III subunit alpha, partial [Verrucomicrobia bacterium]|nr:DNA polymerase III subunit alpha [Verrucomicrobiota bacterium]
SHSAAYGLISYRTAYLKANYPVEFMAGLLSNEINNTDKIAVFVAECQRLGISILPPDINRSHLKFVPETQAGRRGIRYGLAGIKNIGEAAMESAILERGRNGPFKTVEDYCSRLDSKAVNRKILENLIRAGAFDFTGKDRAEQFERIDQSLSAGASAHRDRRSGQVSLFGELEMAAPSRTNGDAAHFTPWSTIEKLGHERDLLGFYVTGHPLDAYRELIERGAYMRISDLADQEEKGTVKIAGSISAFDKKLTRKEGKPFAILTVEDFTGTVEVMVWADVYAKSAKEIEKGKIVTITGKMDQREDGIRIVASEVGPISKRKSVEALTIDIPIEKASEERLKAIRDLVRQYPGKQPLYLRFWSTEGQEIRLKAAPDFSVKDEEAFRSRLAELLV